MLVRTEFNICFYHNPCPDGNSAAWVVKNAVYNKDDIRMVGVQPGFTSHTCDCKNADIICVDVVPCKELLMSMLEECNSLTILDHHETNEKLLETIDSSEFENLYKVFDMTRSGCQIAWDYFHASEERPWFLDYIADRDLWAWKLPDSKEINAGLYELGYTTIDKFDKLVVDDNDDLIEIIRKVGEEKLKVQQLLLDHATKEYYFAKLKNRDEVFVVSTIGRSMRSEYGNHLLNIGLSYNGLPVNYAAIWYYNFINGEWPVSLRSSDAKYNVAQIAERFGGGGHPCASGLTIPSNKSLKDYFDILPRETRQPTM